VEFINEINLMLIIRGPIYKKESPNFCISFTFNNARDRKFKNINNVKHVGSNTNKYPPAVWTAGRQFQVNEFTSLYDCG
jgi:hypothetical protein